MTENRWNSKGQHLVQKMVINTAKDTSELKSIVGDLVTGTQCLNKQEASNRMQQQCSVCVYSHLSHHLTAPSVRVSHHINSRAWLQLSVVISAKKVVKNW